MLFRRFTDFILQGRLSAIAVAFVLAFIPVIGSISVLIAGLVTLRKNAFEGALVFLAASIPIMIQYAMSPAEVNTGMALAITEIALASSLLMWFFAILLRRQSDWRWILNFAIIIGMIAVTTVHVMHPDIIGWWEKQLNNHLGQTLEMMEKLGASSEVGVGDDAQAELVAAVKQYAPIATGLVVTSVLLNVLLQLLMSRWWQIAIFNPGELRKELRQIRLSPVLAGLFVFVLLLEYFKNNLALDLLPVLCAIFAIAGLSLIHYWIGGLTSESKTGWVWLLLIYILIIGLFPMSVVLIAVVALFDTWLDFRKRQPKSSS